MNLRVSLRDRLSSISAVMPAYEDNVAPMIEAMIATIALLIDDYAVPGTILSCRAHHAHGTIAPG